MGLGILADRHLGEDVPGTSLLDDLHSKKPNGSAAYDTNLKRSKSGIVLVPQPSSSPNDPLNWPFWKKCMLMLTITYGAGVVGAFGPVIGAGLTQVAMNLDTTVNDLSMITGDLVLAIGLVLLLTAPASVVWGRRPIFLIGNVLLLVSAIWSAVAKDLGSLTASRVIGGIGMAPIECLVEATIADIFFVHERGTWIAVWSFALLGGICGVSIVNGYLIQDVSWRICFVVEAVLCAILLVLTILFVPETAYRRSTSVSDKTMAINSTSALETATKSSSAPTGSSDVDLEKTSATFAAGYTLEVEVHESYMRSLLPWAGYKFTDESFWRICLRPFTLLCSPVVAWGTLIYGTTAGWLVALSVSVSLLFSSPAYGYDFQAGPVGLISGVGPFIAAILGNAIAGPLSDWSVTWLARRNNGIYEPEFRLFMIIPLLVATTIGWFGWAISANLLELWIGPAVFYSLLNFGQAVGSVAVVSYVVDAHPNYAPEAFATVNCLKNLFTFGLTYYVVPWLAAQGVLRTFCTIGGINIWVCLMTIPMYVYGKRARSWVHRTPWMLA
ncbi:major facilitator superfamily domain-containing protein [Hygrophoropsis aurantiaca]|uniref:Major facilitator superfamily domain-containing protein n=1 Tax=Hygrophoropsis aurantiaca TaxID=72124 RepID=A0ACB8A0B2_9AGAM|nr:major facilitator superfamily domain-containing protein [Hygrophoropsis aurantiaca]